MTTKKQFNVWITKYVMAKGIYKEYVEATSCPTMVCGVKNSYQYYHKPFWHESENEAIAHAKEIQKKKIASLKRQLAKAESTEF